MNKVLLVFAVLGMIAIMSSCDDKPEDKETNPYPDGVYPFEASGA
jgi:hypothetical protein